MSRQGTYTTRQEPHPERTNMTIPATTATATSPAPAKGNKRSLTRPTVSIEMIGPETASKYLKRNLRNRPASPHHAQGIATMMLEGRFYLSNDAIVFDEENVLTNGQTRLAAIVISRTTQPFIVMRGASRKSFYAYDQARARQLGHQLHVMGIPQSNSVAAIAIKAAGWVRSLRISEPQLRGASGASGNIERTTMEQRIEFATTWTEDLLDAVRFTNRIGVTSGTLIKPTLVSFLRFVYYPEWPQIDEFCERAFGGVGIVSPVDPANALRNMLITNSSARSHEDKMPDHAIFGYAVIAANHAINGAKRKQLRWNAPDGYTMPQPGVKTVHYYGAPFSWSKAPEEES